MPMNWEDIIILIVLIQAICLATDKLLLLRHRTQLHDVLIRIWVSLSDQHFMDVPRVVANAVLAAKTKIFGSRLFSFRSGIVSFIISGSLTTIVLISGHYIEPPVKEFLLGENSPTGLAEKPWAMLLGINYVLDVATMLATVGCLTLVSRGKYIVRTLAILLDIFLAILCAGAVAFWLSFQFNFLLSEGIAGDVTIMAYASTTMIPTVIFLCFMLLSGIALLLIRSLKIAAMYFSELATENGPERTMPFTILGVLLNVIVVSMKVGAHFIGKLA